MSKDANKNLISLSMQCPHTSNHLGLDIVVVHRGDPKLCKEVVQGRASGFLRSFMSRYDVDDMVTYQEDWSDDLACEMDSEAFPLEKVWVENVHQTPFFNQCEDRPRDWNEVPVCVTDNDGVTLTFRFLVENNVSKRELKAFKEHVLGAMTRRMAKWVKEDGSSYVIEVINKRMDQVLSMLRSEIGLSCVSAVEIMDLKVIDPFSRD